MLRRSPAFTKYHDISETIVMQQQKLRPSPPVLLTWADTPVRHSPPEPAGPVCPRRAPGRHCEMNAENSNVAVGTGTPGAAEPPYVGSGRAVWPWVNWGLALTTVPAAAIVMLFALGAVMSTDGCSDRSCPNRGESTSASRSTVRPWWPSSSSSSLFSLRSAVGAWWFRCLGGCCRSPTSCGWRRPYQADPSARRRKAAAFLRPGCGLCRSRLRLPSRP